MATLLDALDAHDLAGVLDSMREDYAEIPVESVFPLLAAWEWVSDLDEAPAFAELSLLVLGVHGTSVDLPAGWVEDDGLDLAMRGAEDGDADTATKLAGILLALEPASELVLDLWLEALVDGDGYYDPDSLEDAQRGAADPERAGLLCALERLVAFSLASEHWDGERALELMVRNTKSHATRLTRRIFAEARERLERLGFAFTLPTPEQWSQVEPLLAD